MISFCYYCHIDDHVSRLFLAQYKQEYFILSVALCCITSLMCSVIFSLEVYIESSCPWPYARDIFSELFNNHV